MRKRNATAYKLRCAHLSWIYVRDDNTVPWILRPLFLRFFFFFFLLSAIKVFVAGVFDYNEHV